MLRAARRYPSIYPSTTTAPSTPQQAGDRLQLHVGDLPVCGRGARPARARVGLTSQTAEEQGQGRASC